MKTFSKAKLQHEMEDIEKGIQEVNEVLCQGNWSEFVVSTTILYSQLSSKSNLFNSANLSLANRCSNQVARELPAKDLVKKDSGVGQRSLRRMRMALQAILEINEVFDTMWGNEEDYDAQK